MSRTTTNITDPITGYLIQGYDYINQAWVVDGVYWDCSHPEAGEEIAAFMGLENRTFPGCNCYGRKHVGEACMTDGTARPVAIAC